MSFRITGQSLQIIIANLLLLFATSNKSFAQTPSTDVVNTNCSPFMVQTKTQNATEPGQSRLISITGQDTTTIVPWADKEIELQFAVKDFSGNTAYVYKRETGKRSILISTEYVVYFVDPKGNVVSAVFNNGELTRFLNPFPKFNCSREHE